ncbi:signal peptidase I [Cryobacterium sp. TMS1-13-1]|uniref:signal peptidase I n=1 Tax=Cryobacterium sp. TMS1-13-1 TaxID=1259220 RepID=UPI00106BE603|nr:signal peptidase I [Cryobacterium sp. TMS1-13-1]TFD25605.1 signal peptidase I [Cryobacterium sp. TMS1-13-1]
MKRFKGTVILLLVLAAVLTPVALVATGALPYRAYVVRTGSMSPAILPASVVLVEADQYEVGQVIAFRRADERTTHRLVAINDDGTVTTKGDANDTIDPFTVPAADVIGGVIAFVPRLGYLVVYLQNPLVLGSLITCVLSMWYVGSSEQKPQQKPEKKPSQESRGIAAVRVA